MNATLALLFGLLLQTPTSDALAFRNINVGDAVENALLLPLQGKKKIPLLLGTDKARATVFVFFRPDQPYSQQVLRELVELWPQLEALPVHWALIVSDSYPAKDVLALAKDLALPSQIGIGIDAGDSLYGKLGVVLHPVAGVTDAQHVLVAYQSFTKINFWQRLIAHLRFTLGEIDAAGRDAILNPARDNGPSQVDVAHRNLKLANMLFGMGKYDKALALAEKSLALAPDDGRCLGTYAKVLAAAGRCPEAKASTDKALAADASQADALQAQATCAPKSEPEAAPEAAPQPAPETAPQAAPEAEPQPAPEAKAEPEAGPKDEPAPENKAEPEADPKAEPAPAPAAEPAAKAKPKCESKCEGKRKLKKPSKVKAAPVGNPTAQGGESAAQGS